MSCKPYLIPVGDYFLAEQIEWGVKVVCARGGNAYFARTHTTHAQESNRQSLNDKRVIKKNGQTAIIFERPLAPIVRLDRVGLEWESSETAHTQHTHTHTPHTTHHTRARRTRCTSLGGSPRSSTRTTLWAVRLCVPTLVFACTTVCAYFGFCVGRDRCHPHRVRCPFLFFFFFMCSLSN
jgi:hypothetical protein